MVIRTITGGHQPECIAVSPNDTTVYVTNAADNTVSVINRTTDRVVKTIKVKNKTKVVTVSAHLTADVIDDFLKKD